jgi:hypothetical protein
MSTTPQSVDQTPTTDPRTNHTEARRRIASAPQQFSTTNRAPLPPAFGEEEWANGEP